MSDFGLHPIARAGIVFKDMTFYPSINIALQKFRRHQWASLDVRCQNKGNNRPSFWVFVPQFEIGAEVLHGRGWHEGTLLEGDDLAPSALSRQPLTQFVDGCRDFFHKFLKGSSCRRMQNAPFNTVLDLIVYLERSSGYGVRRTY